MAQRVRWSEFWFLYGRTFRLMGKPLLWAPVMLHGLIAIVLAFMFYNVFSPVICPLVQAWIEVIKPGFSETMNHYPTQFVFLPYFLGNTRLIVNVILEAFLFAIMIDMLIKIYRGEAISFTASFRNALRMYLQVTLTWAVLAGVLFLVNVYFNDFLEKVVGYSLENAPRRQMAASIGVRGLTILIYAPFMFLLPSIMAGEASFGRMLSRGFSVFIRHPFIAVGLILIPYMIGVFPAWAASESGKVAAVFYPELVYYLVLFSIVVDIPVNFLLVGTAVKFYLDQSD